MKMKKMSKLTMMALCLGLTTMLAACSKPEEKKVEETAPPAVSQPVAPEAEATKPAAGYGAPVAAPQEGAAAPQEGTAAAPQDAAAPQEGTAAAPQDAAAPPATGIVQEMKDVGAAVEVKTETATGAATDAMQNATPKAPAIPEHK
ncbi:MAG: hypothetical protein A2521_01085 [Deltaproteobacteria bacterium RIFOXYD12_FULL_57_12]|nr:MAG: hypothetical protein A2521_01085 [Deltaproteobacteria bacterium RIFOXYD12_FULL_57_12]